MRRKLTVTRPENRPNKIQEIEMLDGTVEVLTLKKFATIEEQDKIELLAGKERKELEAGNISSMEFGFRFLERQCVDFKRAPFLKRDAEGNALVEPDALLDIVKAVAELRGEMVDAAEKKTGAGIATGSST